MSASSSRQPRLASLGGVALCVLLTSTSAFAQKASPMALGTPTQKSQKGQNQIPADNYDEMFARYLKEAHQSPAARPSDAWNWMSGLALDLRARRVNDVITISVVENIVGSGTADAALGSVI